MTTVLLVSLVMAEAAHCLICIAIFRNNRDQGGRILDFWRNQDARATAQMAREALSQDIVLTAEVRQEIADLVLAGLRGAR